LQATRDDILIVSQLVRDLCGLVLDVSKGYLIESRLGEIAKTAGCTSFAELAHKARLPNHRTLQNEIIDAITTQETLFFRDDSPFQALQFKVLPDLIDRKAGAMGFRRLRVWSAACSTGQEAYSIAMTLCETLPNIATWDIVILGTDISNTAVRQASLGRYAKHEVQRGMKPYLLQKYFREDGNFWQVKDELRGYATFGHRNLLQPFGDLGPFDIIFCRNVAIYFDAATRTNLFLRLTERLNMDGYLFVGSSESLLDLGPQFTPRYHCRGTYYQPRTAAAPAPPVTPPVWSATPASVFSLQKI